MDDASSNRPAELIRNWPDSRHPHGRPHEQFWRRGLGNDRRVPAPPKSARRTLLQEPLTRRRPETMRPAPSGRLCAACRHKGGDLRRKLNSNRVSARLRRMRRDGGACSTPSASRRRVLARFQDRTARAVTGRLPRQPNRRTGDEPQRRHAAGQDQSLGRLNAAGDRLDILVVGRFARGGAPIREQQDLRRGVGLDQRQLDVRGTFLVLARVGDF